ncbi:hypothetical protein TRIP_C20918 [Candidatus Zixiibacteriota bacterium]|nr:hypothetical protein TRIP_C20918 [candidate division Zixibacteria bacterium]
MRKIVQNLKKMTVFNLFAGKTFPLPAIRLAVEKILEAKL